MLAALRSWLLPMLMNKQVTVSEAYQMEAASLDVAAEPGSLYNE